MVTRKISAPSVKQANFDAESMPPPQQHVQVFVDEVKPESHVPWIFIGYLMIPSAKISAALRDLRLVRSRNGYEKEIHYQKLTNHSASPHGAKTAVARDWLRLFLFDDTKTWHFHLCGINVRRLQWAAFGTGDVDDTVYNRFFRSGLQYGLKKCFDLPIYVDALNHDETHLVHHDYFSWHAIHKFWRTQPGITFAHDRVRFVNSNHQHPGHPHSDAAEFMQMADVLLGTFRQCVVNSSANRLSRK